jgi:ABC-type branched-subunit amino acid transport system ATPase component
MFDIVETLRERGMTVLFVEQNAIMGLTHARWGSVLDLGRTLFDGPAGEILGDPRIQELYLGKAAAA